MRVSRLRGFMEMSDRYDVIVVGGGPAGSTAAAYLARCGRRTMVIERSTFPRHRVGESLLPSMMPVLEDFGLVEACRAAGFVEKTGATFIWGKTREPWDLRFAEAPFLPSGFAFHVERSIFDQILLENAGRNGAEVHLNATVTGLIKDGEKVTGVSYRENLSRDTKHVEANFVIDASGPSSAVGRRMTKRHYDSHMRQIAFYTYFRNVRGAQGFRRNHIVIESAPKGWVWFIPMNSQRLGEASVGLVTGREFQSEIQAMGTQAFYDESRAAAHYVGDLLGPEAAQVDRLQAVRDWAYTCAETAGPGYYLVGDAAAFLDPLLSTGVSLAMLSGYSASVCIESVLSDPLMEGPAREFYTSNYRQMYEVTRDFLHYFYAGNATAHPDELFWRARCLLKFEENVGAKQAFSFFVNTIPGNPHPAVARQVPMFHQFMRNLDHTVNRTTLEAHASRIVKDGYAHVSRLVDDDIPIVNGTLESTWCIDKESHRLMPIRGVKFDKERPVFSSTSSWLLGRNIARLDESACKLLELVDGERSWSWVVEMHARKRGMSLSEARANVVEIATPLLAEDFILVKKR